MAAARKVGVGARQLLQSGYGGVAVTYPLLIEGELEQRQRLSRARFLLQQAPNLHFASLVRGRSDRTGSTDGAGRWGPPRGPQAEREERGETEGRPRDRAA